MWFLEWGSVWLQADTQPTPSHLSLYPIFWPLPPFSIIEKFVEYVLVYKVPLQATDCDPDQYCIWWSLTHPGKCRENPQWQADPPPLTATSTDCMERSHGGFTGLGRVAYQNVVSAANAPKPMSVLVGRERMYCLKSASSGILKYRNNSWACIVLCWWCPKMTSVGREKHHVHSREAGVFSRVPKGQPPNSMPDDQSRH